MLERFDVIIFWRDESFNGYDDSFENVGDPLEIPMTTSSYVHSSCARVRVSTSLEILGIESLLRASFDIDSAASRTEVVKTISVIYFLIIPFLLIYRNSCWKYINSGNRVNLYR